MKGSWRSSTGARYPHNKHPPSLGIQSPQMRSRSGVPPKQKRQGISFHAPQFSELVPFLGWWVSEWKRDPLLKGCCWWPTQRLGIIQGHVAWITWWANSWCPTRLPNHKKLWQSKGDPHNAAQETGSVTRTKVSVNLPAPERVTTWTEYNGGKPKNLEIQRLGRGGTGEPWGFRLGRLGFTLGKIRGITTPGPLRIGNIMQTWPYALPEPNSKFAPENGWLEYLLFSFWDGLFSGANC